MAGTTQITEEKQLFESTLISKFQWELKNFENSKATSFESNLIKVPNAEVFWSLKFASSSRYPSNYLINFDLEATEKFLASADKHEYSIKVKDFRKKYNLIDSSFGQLTRNVTKPGSIEITKQSSGALNHYGSLILKAKLVIVSTKSAIVNDFTDLHASNDSLLSSVKDLLYDSTFADFKFVVGNKEFKVHKCILASVSDVFKTLFTVDMVEKKSNECKMKDVSPKVFEMLLEFIYTRRIQDIGSLAFDLYELANYYHIEDLKKICSTFIVKMLRSHISSEEALKIYEFAHKYELTNLSQDCWSVIKFEILKIFDPIKNEPLPVNKIRELVEKKEAEDNFWNEFM